MRRIASATTCKLSSSQYCDWMPMAVPEASVTLPRAHASFAHTRARTIDLYDELIAVCVHHGIHSQHVGAAVRQRSEIGPALELVGQGHNLQQQRVKQRVRLQRGACG